MAKRQPTRRPSERTEEVWSAEAAFILSESLVATPRTVQRRRRIIERSGSLAFPLHLMQNAQQIIWDADEDEKPERTFPVGSPDSAHPLAWLDRRAWWEWHWIRGVDPTANREAIPLRVKAAVVARDWPNCQLCGGQIALGEQHLDHIVHYSRGGEASVANLRLTHDLCNMQRGVRD